jgi:putative membrane protein
VPETVVLLATAAFIGWLYREGATGRDRSAARGAVRGWEQACFFAGLAVVVVALAAPSEARAGDRLWAHMVQHVSLVAVAAPLLVLGRPLTVLPRTLSLRHRRVTARASRIVARAQRGHTGLVLAGALVLHAATMWAWHAPGPYQAALRAEWVHVLEHATLFGAALLFWSAVAGSRRRGFQGPAVVATFAAALQGTALGAAMTFASRPWYPTAHPGSTGLSVLEDQQVAGVIMWGPCGMIYALAAMLLFAAWLRREGIMGAGTGATPRVTPA